MESLLKATYFCWVHGSAACTGLGIPVPGMAALRAVTSTTDPITIMILETYMPVSG